MSLLVCIAGYERTVQAESTNRAPVHVQAEHLEVQGQTGCVEAWGGVELELAQMTLLASSMEADPGAGTILMHDLHLVLAVPGGLIEASSRSALLTGTEVLLERGDVSPCPCGPAPWSLEFGSMKLDGKGDLSLHQVWLRLGRVKLLPLPWLLVRTGREPGLLPPRLGWAAGRGFTAGIGAYFPLGKLVDLTLHVDWVGVNGLVLEAAALLGGQRIVASVLLDPVDAGPTSGWLAGSGGAGGGRIGIALDLPLVHVMPRADMPGVDGASDRIAMQSLSLAINPGTPFLTVAGTVGGAFALEAMLEGGKWTSLGWDEAWLRFPGAVISLLPIRLFGGKVPVLASAEIRYDALQQLGAPGADPRVHIGALDIDLQAHALAGRVIDLRLHGGWHGAMLDYDHGSGSDIAWVHWTSTGAQARLGLERPFAARALVHRVDLALAWRFSFWQSTGEPRGPAGSEAHLAPALHLAGVIVASSLRGAMGEILSLSSAAWLTAGAKGGDPIVLLAFDARLRLGPLSLQASLDLPSDAWEPSLWRATVALRVGGAVDLTLDHVLLARPGVTSRDIEALAAMLPGAWLAPHGDSTVHVGKLALAVHPDGGLVLRTGAGIDLAAGGAVWVEASVGWAHPCGCLEVNVLVRQRASVPAPDVFFTISL